MIMSRPEAGGPEDRELAFTVVFVYNNYRIDNLPAPGNSTEIEKMSSFRRHSSGAWKAESIKDDKELDHRPA